MTAKKYVNSIVKKINCGREKRNDIAKQLLAEVQERLDAGEELDEVIKGMGLPGEIAQSFNENLSEDDFKAAKRLKLGNIIVAIMIALGAFCMGMYFCLPKLKPIDESKHFDRTVVESELMKVIGLVESEDISSLKEMSSPKMAEYITEEVILGAKESIGQDWGERTLDGTIYLTEVVQMGKHFMICEVTPSYSSVSVSFTITFDQNMELSGLYMK